MGPGCRSRLKDNVWLGARRRVGCVVGAALLALTASGVIAPAPTLAVDNPIVVENQQAGTDAWLSSKLGDDVNGQIKGYASANSVAPGDGLTFYVSVNPVQTYTIEVYRLGWYGGLGGRLRLSAGPLDGIQQPACPVDATTGLIACAWTAGLSVIVPSDWVSGIYVALLTNAQGFQNYVVFVVRDGRPAPFLYQRSVATDQAYNNFPNDGSTGKSLYSFNSFGPNTVSGETRAVKVSFDRPYAGSGAGKLADAELNFVRWFERSGYDVTYSSDTDTHANGAELRNHKAFLSVGQNEYWSKEMFDAAMAARDAGVSLGFFGAAAADWQAGFEPSASGAPNRVLVSYRDAALDPVQGPTTTTLFRAPPVNRPEQTLRGIQALLTALSGTTGYTVTNSSHWAYAGTGFAEGAVVPGIVGTQVDALQSGYPSPPNSSFTLLSQSPFTDAAGAPGTANSSIYQAPSGAWVFGAGTISWSWGLDLSGVVDWRIQQITANVLNRFQAVSPPVP